MTQNLHLLLPEFLLATLAFVVLSADLLLPPERKHLLGWASIAGLVGLLALSLALLWGRNELLYGGLFHVDSYYLFFRAFFILVGIVVILSSLEFVKAHLSHPGEYYAIILFSILGMGAMAAAGELLTAYISLELLSFSLYILVSFATRDAKSNEAGVKYIIIGAFSSAILLYGLSLVYTGLGTTHFAEINTALAAANGASPTVWIGLALVLVGLGFKMAAVPFHMWAPDVYEGAPLPITAYLSVASKAAAFALALRLFAEAFMPAIGDWRAIVAVLAAITMTVGNLVAIPQKNIKRLLAYSSISQVGYLLVGLAALSAQTSSGLMLHLAGYAFTNLAAFGVVIAFYNHTGKEEIADYAGLADRHPFMAAALTIALFSLAGLPFFAGFLTKFYLFAGAAREGFLWLAGLAMFNSLISLYYYLMVIKQMYIVPAEDESKIRVSPVMLGVVAVMVLGVIFVGVYPRPLLDAIDAATRAILPVL
jgi:NADH-quinone oxidoreductase subunit N